MTDIEIAQAAKPEHITEIARRAGLMISTLNYTVRTRQKFRLIFAVNWREIRKASWFL